MIMHPSIETFQWLILPAAFALDAALGDPRALPHPIRWMGWAIESCEPVFRRHVGNQYLSGFLFAAVLIAVCWTATALLARAAYGFNAMVGFCVEVVLIFYCLSARSLYGAAMEIYGLLKDGRVDAARSKLSMIVGRDVGRYDADDIARATVETVAENFVDGVLSPLFFAAIGGAPLAMAYKMVNTLDSMVGYKNERYRQFGCAAARMDDAANFIPARLSAVIIPLAVRLLSSGRWRCALMTALKEGSRHSSPNAGYPEAAFAGALAVKLNGPNEYGGVRVEKPYIGAEYGAAGADHIKRACELMLLSGLVSLALAWIISTGLG